MEAKFRVGIRLSQLSYTARWPAFPYALGGPVALRTRVRYRLLPCYSTSRSWSQVSTLLAALIASVRNLTTHPLRCFTFRLIFWHARDFPPPDEVKGRYYDMAPDNMEFRILDRLEESEGTCLMQMPDWIDEETRKAKNMKHPSLSNLTRLLLLTKVRPCFVLLQHVCAQHAEQRCSSSMAVFG